MGDSTDERSKALTHVSEDGSARMVDVGSKTETARVAVAEARISMREATLAMIEANEIAKGDVLTVARIAAIQAAKRCDELIPLCHSLPLDALEVDFDIDRERPGILIRCSARVMARTGVEMEAMTAASIAALTIYDMCKAVDRDMQIDQLRLLRKEGGRTGLWERGEGSAA
ncbi:MAG: cyclic pyranopterin monophosphate synthase MoaC [Pseudomonadota bacterium]